MKQIILNNKQKKFKITLENRAQDKSLKVHLTYHLPIEQFPIVIGYLEQFKKAKYGLRKRRS